MVTLFHLGLSQLANASAPRGPLSNRIGTMPVDEARPPHTWRPDDFSGLLPHAFGVWAHIRRFPRQVALAFDFQEYIFLSVLSAFAVWRRGRVFAGLVGLVATVGPWGRPLNSRSNFTRYVVGCVSGRAPRQPILACQVLRLAAAVLHLLWSVGRSNFFLLPPEGGTGTSN